MHVPCPLVTCEWGSTEADLRLSSDQAQVEPGLTAFQGVGHAGQFR